MVFLFFSHDGLEREIRKDQAGLAAKCPTENAQRAGLTEVSVFIKNCTARTSVEPTCLCGEISLVGPELQKPSAFRVSREKVSPSLTRGGVAAHLVPDGLSSLFFV